MPAYAVYVTAWRGADPFLGSVSDAAVIGTIAILTVCFLQGVLVDRALARGSARALAEIESRMGARLEAYIEEGFLRKCEALADEATTVLDEIDAAREEVARAAGA
jgi:hypothetical protein